MNGESNMPESESSNPSYLRQDVKPNKARGMSAVVEPQIADMETYEERSCLPYSFSADPKKRQDTAKPRAQQPVTLPHHPQEYRAETRRGHPFVSPTIVTPIGSLVTPSVPGQSGVLPPSANDKWPDLVLQPDSQPISQDQLAAELKSIYANLTMAESKCIDSDNAQATAQRDPVSCQPRRLAPDYWQALISLHGGLLDQHHEFFLVSQHPSAGPALHQLPLKYFMPARMWKYGIHSFLELLRHHLPESLEHMLTFIYLAYQMIALLYEMAPAFENIWSECLGDLGRYRMAIEDRDTRDRKYWAGVARSWYSNAADKSPTIGRLYHHLAILAKRDALQQLSLYYQSLTSVQPFMSARESILKLFNSVLSRSNTSCSHSLLIKTSFIRAHGSLFVRDHEFEQTSNRMLSEFIRQLDSSIGRVTSEWKEQGAYMAIVNIASLFDYGSKDNFLRLVFATQLQNNIRGHVERNDDPDGQIARAILPPTQPAPDNIQLDLQSATAFPFACRLTFDTLQVILRRFGDENVLTHFHILLTFLTQLSTLPYNTSYIFRYVQWEDLAFFLNHLTKSEKTSPAMESPRFPGEGDEEIRPLPEDYLIRTQLWAHSYFPATWFSDVVDEEERMLEMASTTGLRTERILWLGIRLASVSSFDELKGPPD